MLGRLGVWRQGLEGLRMLSGGVNVPKKKKVETTGRAAGKSSSGGGRQARRGEKKKAQRGGGDGDLTSQGDKRRTAQIVLAEPAIDVISRVLRVRPEQVPGFKMGKEEGREAKKIALEYQRGKTREHNQQMVKLFTRYHMLKFAMDMLPTKELKIEASTLPKTQGLPVIKPLLWRPPSLVDDEHTLDESNSRRGRGLRKKNNQFFDEEDESSEVAERQARLDIQNDPQAKVGLELARLLKGTTPSTSSPAPPQAVEKKEKPAVKEQTAVKAPAGADSKAKGAKAGDGGKAKAPPAAAGAKPKG